MRYGLDVVESDVYVAFYHDGSIKVAVDSGNEDPLQALGWVGTSTAERILFLKRDGSVDIVKDRCGPNRPILEAY